MAAAEMRALWQRAANRCFVQEDAKRAPVLAYCQSPCSSSAQLDGGPMPPGNEPDHPAASLVPANEQPYPTLPRDMRWWLQLQPGCGHEKGLALEQLQAQEPEAENLRAEINSVAGDFSPRDDHQDGTLINNHDADPAPSNVLIEFEEGEMVNSTMIKNNCIGCLKCCSGGTDHRSNPNYLCVEGEKKMPWWQATGGGDLASLLAQVSFRHIDNCDLPPPKKMQSKAPAIGFSTPHFAAESCPITDNLHLQVNKRPSAGEYYESGSSELFRSHDGYNLAVAHEEQPEARLVSESDPCKAKLLKALCHSQTRAREAEEVAKQACAEKEHIIGLFFKQASQLFMYKQWFQLLQLQTICCQINNGNQPLPSLLPAALPWLLGRGKKHRRCPRNWSTEKQSGWARPMFGVRRYAVVFVFGLGLVGAGLLLGWTAGWLFTS